MSSYIYNDPHDKHTLDTLMQRIHSSKAGSAEELQKMIVEGLEHAVEVDRPDWIDNIIIFTNMMLLKKDTYINNVVEHGGTLLMHAARLGKTRCVESLARHGASANEVNENGDTALTVAIKSGHLGAVNALLPLTDFNKLNKTPDAKRQIAEAIVVALYNHNVECVAALFKYVEPKNILAEANFDPTILKSLIAISSKTKLKTELAAASSMIEAIGRGFTHAPTAAGKKLEVPGYIYGLAKVLGVKIAKGS